MRLLYRLLSLFSLLLTSFHVLAIDEHYAAPGLSGNQLAPDSTSLVMDTVYFNPSLKPIQTTFTVKNLITFQINEAYRHMLPNEFNVSITFVVHYTYDDGGTAVNDVSDPITLNLDYSIYTKYGFKNAYVMDGWEKAQIEITSISSDVDFNTIKDGLLLTNEILVNREYNFSCSSNAVQTINTSTSYVSSKGELKVYWSPQRAADEYDLEWSYVDSAALVNYLKTGDSTHYDPKKIFPPGATRVSIATTEYYIPLLYEGRGTLFYRVRAVQVKGNDQRIESAWSSDYSGGLGQYDFLGLDTTLNWQASTSFAEDGKRKSVVQYFDGSLKSRQTVTKDNTTDTTVVAETYYDYQGRPVIQVMPTPSLSSIIKFTPNFNRINGAEYTKDLYDGLLQDSCYCTVGAPAMDSGYGAAKYYSGNNSQASSGYHKYIPKARGFAFAETRYTPDNTGRISIQGAVGDTFQIGKGHETRYTYSSANQEEIDALFGTEVGNSSHYFKNTVLDANGQYSISYVDMHGRTIATALAGKPAMQLDTLTSNKTVYITKKLLDSTTNIIKGTVIESSKGLIVTKAGSHRFIYSMVPDSISIKACDSSSVCYDCIYDLKITITDECNNSTFTNHQPIVINRNNYSRISQNCSQADSFPAVDTTVYLREGSYTVTKTLTINQQAFDYYRDSVFLVRNTCKTLQQTIADQRVALASTLQCAPTCASCLAAIGSWDTFRNNYMQNAGILASDSANYRTAVQIAWNKQQAECDLLCNNTALHKSIRQQMLADITPPYGQYANPDSIDIFSVFWLSGPNPQAPYAWVGGTYVDESGQADPLNPKSLNQTDFINEFKPSWADTLLKQHPEYPKLVKFEQLAASNYWDDRFEATDTYQAAVDSGFLNPGNFSTHPSGSIFAYNSTHRDPFFTDLSGGVVSAFYKSRMQDSLVTKAKDTSGGSISMWSLATIMAHCPDTSNIACLYHYKPIDSAFAIGSSCSADLDAAWRYFREMYLQTKRIFIGQLLDTAQATSGGRFPDLTELAANHKPAFYDPAISTAGDMATSASVGRDSLNKFISDNCAAYVQLWWAQLAPCGFRAPADSNVIVPRLIQVCKEGGDSAHLFGSSTVKPTSSYTYKSFEDVIKAYRDSTGKPYNSTCNAYLITSPVPYDQQPVYYDKPIYKKPDSCECATISSLYGQYQAAGTDSSFAAYLYRTSGTVMRQGALDTLRMACNGGINCSFLPSSLSLPPVLQCGVKDVCVNCSKINNLYLQFKQKFPDVSPTYDNNDSLQRLNNALFRNFMNAKLGFQKDVSEYLDFIRSCRNNSTFCDSIDLIQSSLAGECRDTASWAISRYLISCSTSCTNVYDTDVPSISQVFSGGIAHLPIRYDSVTIKRIRLVLSKQIPLSAQGLVVEARVKMPRNAKNLSLYDLGFGVLTNTNVYYSSFYQNDNSTYHPGYNLVENIAPDFTAEIKDVYLKENNIGINNSNFLKTFDDWKIIKIKIANNQFYAYYNDTLLQNSSYSGSIDSLKKCIFDFKGHDGSIDYIKIYDTTGLEYYEQNFYGCSNCQSSFSGYWNEKQNAAYNYTQLDSLSYHVCGTHLNVCSTYDTVNILNLKPNLILCGKTDAVFAPTTIVQHQPCDDSTLFATSVGRLLQDAYTDSITGSFNDRYLAKCLKVRYNENFTVYQPVSEYHYTLYYYDQAGNLIKTVPPAGVDVSKFAWASAWSDSVTSARRNKQRLTPAHTLSTQYRFNTLNQPVAQQSPDAGLTEFWYDRLGRLVISRNAHQKAVSTTENNRYYSYTQYDSLGRITEVGQVSNTTSNGAMTDSISRSQTLLGNWLAALTSKRSQITNTIYDLPYTGFTGIGDTRLIVTQCNLRNRVSYTTLTDTGTSTAYNQATFYTYDILGNVDTLLQDFGSSSFTATANVMNKNNNRWKKIAYKYDLISGKVNMVMYQRGWRDGFYHRYSYDAENRLTLVETSSDSLVWETEARYDYYRHGALARTTLGHQQVQGLDYAYTLQGWLKGINSTGGTAKYDMGTDAYGGSINQFVGKDAIGLTLNYFANDYSGINGAPFPGYSAFIGSSYKPLYNGNISSMSVYQKRFEDNTFPGGALIFYAYKYDQLNRLTGQDAFKGTAYNITTNLFDSLPTMGQYLKERITYDANGNITRYLRNSISGTTAGMDSLTYKYYTGTNRLRYIKDSVTSAYLSDPNNLIWDLKSQSDSNYVYDEIGNLVKDNKDSITSIKWNVYGKITEINRIASTSKPATKIQYTYDALGNRISQIVTTATDKAYTWFVRDAQGNVLSTYTTNGTSTDLASLGLNQTELYLYGSNRLGVRNLNEGMGGSGPDDLQYYHNFNYDRGWKRYELSNHLGNVLATISDRKLAVPSDTNSSLISYYVPDIVSAQDYYPFGMLSRVAVAGDGSSYRFGFNGKMMDNDVMGLGNEQDYGMRIYDPRVGRFLSVDPLQKKFAWNSSYAYAENDVIRSVDLDGLEKVYHYQITNIGTPILKNVETKGILSDISYTLTYKDKTYTSNTYHPWNEFIGQAQLQKATGSVLWVSRVDANANNASTIEQLNAAADQQAGEIRGFVTANREYSQESVANGAMGLTIPVMMDVFSSQGGKTTPSTSTDKMVTAAHDGEVAASETNTGSPNRGLGTALEDVSKRNPIAQAYEDATTGAASDVATKKRIVPTLKFDNPNPNGKNFIKLDGFDAVNSELIDRKWNITTYPKQLQAITRLSQALQQNAGYKGVIEVPNQKVYNSAIRAIRKARVNNISVRIAPPKN